MYVCSVAHTIRKLLLLLLANLKTCNIHLYQTRKATLVTYVAWICDNSTWVIIFITLIGSAQGKYYDKQNNEINSNITYSIVLSQLVLCNHRYYYCD